MQIKVIELYSGIGGMHFALKGSEIGKISEIVLAVELNPVCNEVYKHNFPNTRLLNRNIVSMLPSDFNLFEPNLLLMSPPCQPFTRLGKRGDVNDARNDSLMHFIEIIPQLTSLSFILLENVAGFEISETRRQLLDVLRRSNYVCEEFLLNPRQFGICNSRLRYYLLAKRTIDNKDITSSISAQSRIYDTLPGQEEYINSLVRRKLHDFLEYDDSSPGWDEYLVGIEKMYKYLSVVDVVAYDESNSCCFTRGYSRYLKGTGSVLANTTKQVLEDFKSKWKTSCVDSNLKNELIGEITTLKFRHFTPREVARLMMFPDTFDFPSSVTKPQRYKLISNSINVYVVSMLITYLTRDVGL